MLHAEKDEAFIVALLNKHYKVGSLILNTVNNIEDKDETIKGYNFGKKELIIKDAILELISKLEDLSLEFVIDTHSERKNYSKMYKVYSEGQAAKILEEGLKREDCERIMINNLSIKKEGEEIEEQGIFSKKSLSKMASFASWSSVSSIILPPP